MIGFFFPGIKGFFKKYFVNVVHTFLFNVSPEILHLWMILTNTSSGSDPAGRLLPGPHPPRGGGRRGAAALWPGRHQARPPELGQGPATQVNNKFFQLAGPKKYSLFHTILLCRSKSKTFRGSQLQSAKHKKLCLDTKKVTKYKYLTFILRCSPNIFV